jgi:hypothetical protein
MAVKVRITPEAEWDLTAIGDDIARDSPGNALEPPAKQEFTLPR